ncbi:MAG TPA: hypothetical protein VGR38_08650, partial [Candidatus Polarisedimenticolia bacterium]|nr:hypothetical protein [Candidatus Polarisedimenticolia bacterium]
IELSDPVQPESRQPYHDGAGIARSEGPELSRLLASVQAFGRRSVTELMGRFRGSGTPLQGAGIVVGSLIDPGKIANDHIRIHALEGLLYREVVQDALRRCELPCSLWRERDLRPVAHEALGQKEAQLRGALRALGRTLPGPWRAEQKSAALAAWLVLAGVPLSKASEER